MTTKRWVPTAIGLAIAAGLTGCGGGDAGNPQAHPFASIGTGPVSAGTGMLATSSVRRRALAAPARSITADELMDWAEAIYPETFPKGPQTEQLTSGGITYTLRHYPTTGSWVGVGSDGQVYALGEFTGNEIKAYGPLANYTCSVDATLCVEPPTVRLLGTLAVAAPQGARACLDLNDNGACDTGEPLSAPSDAQGRFTLDVAPGDAGQHRLVVEVPAGTVDTTTGLTASRPILLQSPASGQAGAQAVFVSPLTSLVQVHMDLTGQDRSSAAAQLQALAGLSTSPLDDFTAGGSSAQQQAAITSKMIQATADVQMGMLAPTLGAADVSGGTVTTADLRTALSRSIIDALPGIATLAADPAIASATGTTQDTIIQLRSLTAASQLGLTAQNAPVLIGMAKLAPEPQLQPLAAPGASISLAALRYTDASHWIYRSFSGTAEDAIPDAQGLVHFRPEFKERNGSTVNAWAHGNTFSRSGDVHWRGDAWSVCELGQRDSSTVRDAAGRASYSYCGGYEKGMNLRSTVDVSGQAIATVVKQKIRTFPGSYGGINYADWGPADLAALGNATFPSGSKLQYQTTIATDTQFAYDARPSGGQVYAYSALVSSGGDVRKDPALACGGSSAQLGAQFKPAATLEELVAANTGRPCVFARGGSGANVSLPTNEWWGNATVSLGTLADTNLRPPGTGTYYTTGASLRVSFNAATGTATYYNCLVRASDSSPRNCTAIGSGSFSVQTVGDARVLTFTQLPELAKRAGYDRAFVERAGQVFYGWKNLPGSITYSLRLNTAATLAVFSALGLESPLPH